MSRFSPTVDMKAMVIVWYNMQHAVMSNSLYKPLSSTPAPFLYRVGRLHRHLSHSHSGYGVQTGSASFPQAVKQQRLTSAQQRLRRDSLLTALES